MAQIKKLIEVALPLEKINAEAAREKSIRHGHPSTLHLWWARRPLAAARAVIWASLVDDPSSHPEEFPTEEAQAAERERLFRILEQLVVWENSNNEQVLDAAKAEIMKSTNGNPPELLDPFAGGGAIPLEAQRLGLKAHAHDLNPVAVMINKAMIEIPPRFAGMPPVNPEARRNLAKGAEWKGAAGLAEDVRYYGEWMKQKAFKQIGHLYPKVKVPAEQGGGEATVIAWIWARTVKCPNPACGCEMPMASSFILSKKKGHEAWGEPIFEDGSFHFYVHNGKCPADKETNKPGRSAVFQCPHCHELTTDDYVKSMGKEHRIGAQLMAVVAEGSHGRLYISPDAVQESAADVLKPDNYPDGPLPENPRWFSPPAFGMSNYAYLFTNRQLTALTTFCDLLDDVQDKAFVDAKAAGLVDDGISIADGGSGSLAYAQAIRVYLSFLIDKLTDYHSSLCSWHLTGEKLQHTYGRQALPMIWDFAEANPFCTASGSFSNMNNWIVLCLQSIPTSVISDSKQFDAQSRCDFADILISTDPPYYDNIGYADLSDYFYIWMRCSLKQIYPKLFRTLLVPKQEELVATPYHFGGNGEKAKQFFEEGMANTCKRLFQYSRNDIPVSIYYAYKQSDGDFNNAASSGWETMLTAIIQSGFTITGTWPMRTEMSSRSIAVGTNALSTSIVLVCRKRPEDSPSTTRRNFIAELKRELRPALKKLQDSNIAPVDLAQSAIGPGMGVFSKYKQVLDADNNPMSVRAALQFINQELDVYFNEQDGVLDADSRFCVELYTQFAFNELKYGDADTLARAKNTSVEKIAAAGVLSAKKGTVRLLERDELPEDVRPTDTFIWRLTQQLTQAMETGGIEAVASLTADMLGGNAEAAKDLAYRLFTIADRKHWNAEAYAYNNLVSAWPDIQSRAAEVRRATPKQEALF